MKMYTLYDSAAQAFTVPFFMEDHGLALRAFTDNVNSDKESNISLHPEQFTLFYVADFDTKTASIQIQSPAKELAKGIELISANTKQYTNIDMKYINDKLDLIQKTFNELSKQTVFNLTEVN